MEPIETVKTATLNRDLRLIDGESRQLRSNYYQQLVKYTRSCIRVLNKHPINPDVELHCLKQLWLTHLEMERMRSNYKAYTSTPEPTPNGPNAS